MVDETTEVARCDVNAPIGFLGDAEVVREINDCHMRIVLTIILDSLCEFWQFGTSDYENELKMFVGSIQYGICCGAQIV